MWRQQLQAGVGEHPGVVEGGGAVLGQVLLPQVAGEADDPGVLALSDVGEHPDVRGTHHVELVADGGGAPLRQRLEVNPAGAVQQVRLRIQTHV